MQAVRLSLLTLVALSAAVPLVVAAQPPASVPALAPGWPARMAAMLPQPGQLVQPMSWRSSGLTVELPQRVAAIGGDREALRVTLSKAARGEIPQYDQRLGISREEFESYLVFQSSLVPSGRRLKLPVTREGNRLRFGDASGLDGLLSDLVLDLTTGELRTPEGFSGRPRTFVASTDQERRLGVRSGLEWNIRGTNPYTQNGINATLHLLQLGNGQLILDYARFGMLRGTTSGGRVILQYTR
jgi:hypothetical protein